MIIKGNNYSVDNSQAFYRQMLFDEFERECDTYCDCIIGKEGNTIELLLEVNRSSEKAEDFERENEYYKRLYQKEDTIEKDTDNMRNYLDDPERIIKMIRIRHSITC